MQNAYQKPADLVLAEMKSSKDGLNEAEVGRRLAEFGRNKLKQEARERWYSVFYHQFTDPLVVILIIASILSGLLNERTDAVVILVVVIINAIVGFLQEFKAERSLEALLKMTAPKARVARQGSVQMIDAELLVPGDIVLIEAGDRIPADARLIESFELRTDEAALTGESVPAAKSANAIQEQDLPPADQKGMVFMGTTVTQGRASAVVTATGMSTNFGRVAHLTLSIKSEPSPLQKETEHLGAFIGKLTVAICVIIFISELIKAGSFSKEILFTNLIFAVALAVAAVPEGLPATVTVALALGMQRMAKRNAIIRRLSAVETLGSTTVICSDKTGTLTRNEMTVTGVLVDGRSIAVTGSGYNPEGSFFEDSNKSPVDTADTATRWIAIIAAGCNNAVLNKNSNSSANHSTDSYTITGDPTEGALIVLGEKAGITRAYLDRQFPRVHEFPFDSTRKMMTTVHRYAAGLSPPLTTNHKPQTSKFLVCCKGSPEIILERSTHVLEKGRIVLLDEERRKFIRKKNGEMASHALRNLGFAYKEAEKIGTQQEAESKLVFVGLMGMIDPPRPEVPDAIAACTRAGIRLFVITGDQGLTAHAVARQVGLAEDGTRVVEGPELDKLSDDSLNSVLRGNAIFARVNPEHKLRIVSLLEKNGEIVAVTGDGVNDAPALKKARIGVAMGISGTDVSKEAAAMVLADDSFHSIVAAVQEGRCIYANIKKFLRYLIGSNIGEVIVVFAAVIADLPLPLIATQLLWINLVTDVFPALALGVSPAEAGIMNQKPRDPRKRMLSSQMLLRMFFVAGIVAVGTLGVYIGSLFVGGWSWGAEGFDNGRASTMAFTVLVFFELFNAVNCLAPLQTFIKVFLKNHWMIAAVALSFILQLIVVYLPAMNTWFSTVPLTATEWLVCIAIAGSVLVAEELRKWLDRRRSVAEELI